jgi:hypothetical protein
MTNKPIDELKMMLGPFSVEELFYMIADVAYNVGYNDARGTRFQSDNPTEAVLIKWLEDSYQAQPRVTIEKHKSPN